MKYGWPNPDGRYVRRMQWVASALVPAGTAVQIHQPYDGSQGVGTLCGDLLPYTFPQGYCGIITRAYLASKFGSVGRSSYAYVGNVVTLTDVEPQWIGAFFIPTGGQITLGFQNNEQINETGGGGEAQWMNCTMEGIFLEWRAGDGTPIGDLAGGGLANWFRAFDGLDVDIGI